MPAGSTLSPWAIPRWWLKGIVVFFKGFPKDKVVGVFLEGVFGNSCPGQLLCRVSVRKEVIFRISGNVKEDVPPGLVCMPFVNEGGYHVYHVLNMLSGFRLVSHRVRRGRADFFHFCLRVLNHLLGCKA